MHHVQYFPILPWLGLVELCKPCLAETSHDTRYNKFVETGRNRLCTWCKSRVYHAGCLDPLLCNKCNNKVLEKVRLRGIKKDGFLIARRHYLSDKLDELRGEEE